MDIDQGSLQQTLAPDKNSSMPESTESPSLVKRQFYVEQKTYKELCAHSRYPYVIKNNISIASGFRYVMQYLKNENGSRF